VEGVRSCLLRFFGGPPCGSASEAASADPSRFEVWFTLIVKYGFSCLWPRAVMPVAVTAALLLDATAKSGRFCDVTMFDKIAEE